VSPGKRKIVKKNAKKANAKALVLGMNIKQLRENDKCRGKDQGGKTPNPELGDH
jgi:hypothetical protein